MKISLEEDLVRFSNLLTSIGQLEWLCQNGDKDLKGGGSFRRGRYGLGYSQPYPYQLHHARKNFARLIKVIRKKQDELKRTNTE